MRTEQCLRVKCRLAQKLEAIQHYAIQFHWTADKLTGEYLKVMASAPRGTPRWVREYLEGAFDHWRSQLFGMDTPSGYQYYLEFCYLIDDELYSVAKGSKRDYRKAGLTAMDLCLRSTSNGFYWVGTDKPYFIGED